MIYSVGKTCPICFDSSDVIFLKNVISNQIFFTCYACHCACDCLPLKDCGCGEPHDFAPDGYALAGLEDIEKAGLVSLIADVLPDGNLLFDGHKGFVPPERYPHDYDGKTIAVTLAASLPNGEKDYGVLIGKTRYENGKLYVYFDFTQEKLEIKQEWLCRIKSMYRGIRAPYSEAELHLSLARGAFLDDAPPNKLMQVAQRLKSD